MRRCHASLRLSDPRLRRDKLRLAHVHRAFRLIQLLYVGSQRAGGRVRIGFRRILPFGAYKEDPLSLFYEKPVAGTAGEEVESP